MLCALLLAGGAGAASHAAPDAACPHHSNEGAAACSAAGCENCPHKENGGNCAHHKPGRGHGCMHGGKHGMHGKHKGGDPEAMAEFRARMETLKLSDQQQQDMASLIQLYEPRLREIRERGRADREALIVLAPDADDYDERVAGVATEAAAAAREVVVLLAELQANAYALLTPEQQAEYQALKADIDERRREWEAGREERMEGWRERRGDWQERRNAWREKHADCPRCAAEPEDD